MTNGNKYIPPKKDLEAFHCPHCDTYAHQKWFFPLYYSPKTKYIDNLQINFCERCKKYSIWFKNDMVYPTKSSAPMPSENMPVDVQKDYMEARTIVNKSPRAAAALLRLGLEKLIPHLGEKGKNLNDDIGNLVKKGLSSKIQKSLDGVRIIGNHAVHPGLIDLKDDIETAIRIFELLNIIVDVMITQPKKIDEVYEKIPQTTKIAIENRNGKKK